MDGNTGIIFVAEIEEDVAGFIHLEADTTPSYRSVAPHKFCVIVDLYVKAKYRRKGIGRKLLFTARQWQLENNLEYIELMALGNSSEAIGFYENEGFSISSIVMRSD